MGLPYATIAVSTSILAQCVEAPYRYSGPVDPARKLKKYTGRLAGFSHSYPWRLAFPARYGVRPVRCFYRTGTHRISCR